MEKAQRQFSFRELILLALVNAMAVGWLIDRKRLIESVKDLRLEVELLRTKDLLHERDSSLESIERR